MHTLHGIANVWLIIASIVLYFGGLKNGRTAPGCDRKGQAMSTPALQFKREGLDRPGSSAEIDLFILAELRSFTGEH